MKKLHTVLTAVLLSASVLFLPVSSSAAEKDMNKTVLTVNLTDSDVAFIYVTLNSVTPAENEKEAFKAVYPFFRDLYPQMREQKIKNTDIQLAYVNANNLLYFMGQGTVKGASALIYEEVVKKIYDKMQAALK